MQRVFACTGGQHGRHQAKNHAREGGVGTGHEQAGPDDGTRQHIGIRRPNAHLLEAQHHQHPQGRHNEAAVIKPAGIEERDDQHRNDVINDGQGQQKNAHVARDGAPQERQNSHGERDVGGGGNGPAVLPDRLCVQGQVDQCRNDDTTHCSGHGQCRLAQATQCTLVDFSADFHSDDQKEDRHQGIVDPEMQRLGKNEAPHAKRHWRVPECVVTVGQWRVRP